jgi:hypothetical protein
MFSQEQTTIARGHKEAMSSFVVGLAVDAKTVPLGREFHQSVKVRQIGFVTWAHGDALPRCQADVVSCLLFHPREQRLWCVIQVYQQCPARLNHVGAGKEPMTGQAVRPLWGIFEVRLDLEANGAMLLGQVLDGIQHRLECYLVPKVDQRSLWHIGDGAQPTRKRTEEYLGTGFAYGQPLDPPTELSLEFAPRPTLQEMPAWGTGHKLVPGRLVARLVEYPHAGHHLLDYTMSESVREEWASQMQAIVHALPGTDPSGSRGLPHSGWKAPCQSEHLLGGLVVLPVPIG